MTTFEEKLEMLPQQEVWDEYCGFLDLSLDEYMSIQERLLAEQLDLMSQCELGKRLFAGADIPKTADEFRRTVPLTRFDDYADILLRRMEDMLPAPAAIWLETTWEGDGHPMKCAPYTKAMLETYKKNILAAMILSTSERKGSFRVRSGARVLFSLAPLPYASGLFPSLVDPEIKIRFLPSLKESAKLSFGERCKKGFKLSLKGGMDQFYGMTSIVYNMSKNFDFKGSGGSLRDMAGISPKMLAKIARAKYLSKRDGRSIYPRDVFDLEGFVVIGADTAMYKPELERLWGKRPLELAGGTETCLLGTEPWSKDGIVFFPDNCFYEFISERDMLRNIDDPSFTPPTYLMDEIVAGEKYELVITVLKGGAFMRYRVGDVFRCLRLKNSQNGLALPQFQYVDRVPTVIDIDGFTRITHREIDKVIELSGLPVSDYIALKEYSTENRPFLHLLAEMDDSCKRSHAIDARILEDHLSIYFRYVDDDYNDLKRMLGIDPLQVTILPHGSITAFEATSGEQIGRINPAHQDVVDLLLSCQRHDRGEEP